MSNNKLGVMVVKFTSKVQEGNTTIHLQEVKFVQAIPRKGEMVEIEFRGREYLLKVLRVVHNTTKKPGVTFGATIELEKCR